MRVWVLFTYRDGYPTMPLGVYSTPAAAMSAISTDRFWRELPKRAFNGRGGWTSLVDGVAVELVPYQLNDREERS